MANIKIDPLAPGLLPAKIVVALAAFCCWSLLRPRLAARCAIIVEIDALEATGGLHGLRGFVIDWIRWRDDGGAMPRTRLNTSVKSWLPAIALRCRLERRGILGLLVYTVMCS